MPIVNQYGLMSTNAAMAKIFTTDLDCVRKIIDHFNSSGQ